MSKLYTGRPHRDRATLTYAGQDRGHLMVGRAASAVRTTGLPTWMGSPRDLDFLDHANPLFHTDRALFSMGQYLYGAVPTGMFTPRPGVTILGDSGGFQLINHPALWRGDATRRWVLTALEHHTDEAMTLDVPTRGVAAGTPWPTFDDALAVTVDGLRYFDRHRLGRTRFLNVLQGENRRDALTWYEAVRWFPAGGWAFGGGMRQDWSHVADMLARIHADGLLVGERNRLHFLGMADLRSAVALSALQRGMRLRTGDDGLFITFDVSSPSFMASKRLAYGLPSLSQTTFSSTSFHPQTVLRPGREHVPFAASHTSVGARLRMGELCVPKPGSVSRTAWDGLSEELLTHHNVEALLFAIDAANRILELHPQDAAQLAPSHVVNAYGALVSACQATDPRSYLRPFGADLARM